jgi:hypothetical protein
MKQKVFLLAILGGLLGLLFTFKKGSFFDSDDEYAILKLPETIDYNFHIKPILSDNCYTCHGPDANKRKSGASLGS